MILYFIGSETLLFLLIKTIRGDLMYWPRVYGPSAVAISVLVRVIGKIVVDFTGCTQFRHPYELGGAAFSASVVWAQIMPFVALLLSEEKVGSIKRETIRNVLLLCFGAWALSCIALLRTIDLR